MQIGNKKTTLKDNAALYTHETDGMTEREKFKSLKGRKKWIQFRDYYLLKIVAIVAVLAFVASLLYTVLKPRPETVFYAAISDYVIDFDEVEALQQEFDDHIKLDTQKQETLFDTSFLFKTTDTGSTQKFAVYMTVGQMSVVILPQSAFEERAVYSYFKPLSEILPTDLYLKLTDRMVMSGIYDEDGVLIDDSEKAYGIRLDGLRHFEKTNTSEPVVLAVASSWVNDDICVDFIEFLLK